jgi:hypothetical protein
MERWITAIRSDTGPEPLAGKVVRNRPTDLVPSCWIDGRKITDLAVCDETFPYYREPRTVAGDAPTIYTMKCRLKPLLRKDYTVSFTDGQWRTLEQTFPSGVCDFSREPTGFQSNVAWLTYQDGPGGIPLGAPPTALEVLK